MHKALNGVEFFLVCWAKLAQCSRTWSKCTVLYTTDGRRLQCMMTRRKVIEWNETHSDANHDCVRAAACPWCKHIMVLLYTAARVRFVRLSAAARNKKPQKVQIYCWVARIKSWNCSEHVLRFSVMSVGRVQQVLLLTETEAIVNVAFISLSLLIWRSVNCERPHVTTRK